MVPPGGCFEGRVCLDGSGTDPRDPLLKRVGWGAVQVGRVRGDQVLGSGHGALSHPLQEVGMGEILAAAVVERFCIPPITLVTDYQNLVDGLYVCIWARRRQWLWLQVRRYLEAVLGSCGCFRYAGIW